MRTRLRLFLEWGITFDEEYRVEEQSARKVYYADREALTRAPCDIQRRGYGTGADRSSTYTRGEEHRAGRSRAFSCSISLTAF